MSKDDLPGLFSSINPEHPLIMILAGISLLAMATFVVRVIGLLLGKYEYDIRIDMYAPILIILVSVGVTLQTSNSAMLYSQTKSLNTFVSDTYGIADPDIELSSEWNEDTTINIAEGGSVYQLLQLNNGEIMLVDQGGQEVAHQ